MERLYDQINSMSILHGNYTQVSQPGLLQHVKLSPFGTATATITQECFAVMLVFRMETPLLRQGCRKLSVEGLADVLGQHRQELEGTVCFVSILGRI